MAAAFVRKLGGNARTTSGTTLAVTPVANAATGDFLICACASGGGQNVTSITDTKSNTWTSAADAGAGTNSSIKVLWTRQDGGALTTSDTITITFDASLSNAIAIISEFSGITTSAPSDASGTHTSTTSTAMTATTSGSITNGNDLLIGAFAWQAGSNLTCTPGASFAGDEQDQGSGAFLNVYLEYQVLSGAGLSTKTATGTISGAPTNSSQAVVAFLPSSVSAPTDPGSWIQPPGRSPAARFATRRGLTMLGTVEEILGGIGAGLTIAGSVPQTSVTSVAATATAAALAPTILVTMTPSAAAATAQALTPVLQSTIQPAAAAATAAALAPALLVTVAPPVATATALALAPAGLDTIQPAAAAATAIALAPVLLVTIQPTAATATAQALVPAVIVPITITPSAATATALALAPALLVTVPIPAAAATAAGVAPALFVTILPVAATGSAVALVPTILTGVVIQPAAATATAAGLVPAVRVTILPAVTTAGAAALAPAILAGAVIQPPIATASALALVPGLSVPLTMLSPIATASAAALVPVVVVPAPGFVAVEAATSLIHAAAYYHEMQSLTHGMQVFYGQFVPPTSYTTGGVSYVLPTGIAASPQSAVVMNFHPVGGYSFEYIPKTGVVKIYSAGGAEVAGGTNLQTLGYVPYVAFPIRQNIPQ